MAVAGDVLLHNTLWGTARNDAREGRGSPALDFKPMFRSVRRVLTDADLAVCHLETPLSSPRGPFRNYPRFSVPPQVVDGLKHAGFDVCTTASNHSLDQGHGGLARTLRHLDRESMAHTGTARSATEARRTATFDVKGLRVALLSYTYGTNGIPVDADKPWSVNLIDPARIRADARRAKARGADAVLVALHWGTEYQNAPSAYQRRIADQVTRSPDVDLLYGHHAHVLQPIRRVNGTWVAFGLGNFVAQQDPAIRGVYDGMIAQFDLVRDRFGQVSVTLAGYRPTYITHHDLGAMRVLDVRAALNRGNRPSWLHRDLAQARNRVVDVAEPRGTR